MSDRNVLCIGLDAACFEQITPLLDDGDLPNLSRLRSRGTSGTLSTTAPPWTPSAWSSVTTGTKPWTHGIYDFFDYTTPEPHLVSAADVQVPHVWEYLGAGGYNSIVVNVPVTHPVYELSGSLVPGYLAPAGSDILIDGERAPQSALADDYRIYARDRHGRDATIAENEALIDSRVAAARTLADRHDWSFMMVQFQRTDSIFHTMGHDTDAVQRIYRRVDEAIGELLDMIDDETTVFVVSDHGIHEYERAFRCNTWLRDEGWLRTSSQSERRSWGETTKPTAENTAAERSLSRRVLGTALTTLHRLGITPQRAEKALSVVGLSGPVRRMLPDDVLMSAADHVDWEASRAYCRSVSSLGLRCNVQGRDPGGVVPEDDFEAVRSQLVDGLETLTAPDGSPIFDEVYDRHRRHGADVANEASAPDVVLRPTDMVWKVTDVVREPVFETTDEFSHTYDGLFIAAGPSIDPDVRVEPTVTDIAPTILASFGYRPAPIMDGTVPGGLFDHDRSSFSDPPEPDERTYFTDDQDDSSDVVTDRLEQLGYLE